MTYVLDTSALLRFMDLEAGFDRVRELFDETIDDGATVLMSCVNWGEIITVLHKRADPQRKHQAKRGLTALPFTIVEASVGQSEMAGELKATFGLPYVDAFAAALAVTNDATLVSADYDFKALPKGTLKVEFLPAK